MYNTESFVKQLTEKYPPHQGNKTHFDIKNIENFESELGTELPSDFYDFLLAYGSGSFNDFFFVWHPFTEGGADEFFQNNKQAEENYKFLENSLDASWRVDCCFSDNKLITLNGDKKFTETLRTEQIDAHTRSKIMALGNHYPYHFFPEKDGMVYWGRTDDDDFFLRIRDEKNSIIMYSDGYYEFDMGITEFIYEYLTGTIRLPMMHNETGWDFISYES